MAFCRKCGEYFAPNHVRFRAVAPNPMWFRVAMHPTRCMERKPTNTNQIYCSKCSFWMTKGGGRFNQVIKVKASALKAAADASGNPRIWTAQEYSQEFLKSLIPRM